MKKINVILMLLPLVALIGCKNVEKKQPQAETTLVEQAPIEKLLTMFSGEFDSIDQMRADQKEDSIPEDDKHGRVNRIFVRVNAPKVGKYILVGSTRYNGHDDKPWYFDKTEFLVWIFEEDTNGKTITMRPKKFKDIESKIPHVRDSVKLSGFGPEDLEDGKSGAICHIVWTPTETGFSGRNKPCKVFSTTTQQLLNFKWEYELDEGGMFAEVNGLDDDGKIIYSTPGIAPYRLKRVN
ncbi:hypothetical protein ABN763_05705 [Spongiivirga sp. MCCC 1A20706]|uniref:hypothetical protein n=1 Tax=Spongiivirga sp. MCCC 1A20706 TaxID=3160963 RepID=UPI00397762F7